MDWRLELGRIIKLASFSPKGNWWSSPVQIDLNQFQKKVGAPKTIGGGLPAEPLIGYDAVLARPCLSVFGDKKV